MVSGTYYRITAKGNEFIFLVTNITENLGRDIAELPLPYVKDQLMYDQVSTTDEVQATGVIHCGTGFPYATTKAARTALRNLMNADVISSVTLEPGDWNGSSFSADSSRNWDLPDGTQTMIIQEAQCSETPDALDRLSVTFTLKIGSVL